MKNPIATIILASIVLAGFVMQNFARAEQQLTAEDKEELRRVTEAWDAVYDKHRPPATLTTLTTEKRDARAPGIVKDMYEHEICVAYGEALRGEEIQSFGELSPGIAIKLVKADAHRRKLKLNDSQIRKKQIRIGMSECQLYATLGLPDDQNSFFDKTGVHIQFIYGSTYVYTENERVTSWQE